MKTTIVTRKEATTKEKHLMWWLNKSNQKGCKLEGKADLCM